MIASFSDISYLLPKKQTKNLVSTPGKETEPILKDRLIIESKNTAETEPVVERKTTQASVQVVPELPEIDDELKDMGVELEDSDTIFVNSRKIELPLPLEQIHEGLHKPLSSGWRWLSEITKYILARFNIVIKKKGNKLKLVEQG